jgi:general secretion pathway protein K
MAPVLNRIESTRPRRGAILVGVLWITLLLSGLAVVLRIHMSTVAQSVRMTEDKAAASTLADAGLAVAAAHIREAAAETGRRIGYEASAEVLLASGTAATTLRNEALRVDLNRAPLQLIEGALIAAGATRTQADKLAQALVDMREATDASPLGPLQSIDELAFLPGMPAPLAIGATRFATVSSGLEGVRLDGIDDVLLRAIPDLPRAVANAIAAHRAGKISQAQLDAVLADSELHTTARSNVWRATLDVSLANGYAETREALILVADGDTVSHRVLDWRRPPDEVD